MAGGSGEAAMSPPSSSASGKRGRDPEEDVYVDNLHSHKRYLSEIMASSLNGLSVGDSLPDNIMESPARSETASCYRDEILSQYSPMSEDSDDYRCYDTQLNPSGNHPDAMISPSTSPMSSPHRHQRPQSSLLPSNPYPLPSCSLSSVVCSHARRGSDNEGRFPSSPNDMCHVADLRRTALLRSVQMRVQGPHSYDLSFGIRQGQDHAHEHEGEHDHEHEHLEDLEGTEGSSCNKSIVNEVTYNQRRDHDFGRSEHEIDYINNSTSDDCVSDLKFKQEDKSHSKFDIPMHKNS
ncbi:uncharacterized protein LOC100276193 [Zea mays]|nr:uncharacterized protein LOC100276193 [Zea mays]ACF83142.1 unknown [Zea mays]AQK92703.1 hypothetical protein ZEAMMB73_Zm00001d009787 [Zea mays]|eukprot:NP_001143510.2 uncharacterized protein LOC100276193 [Zea mays]